MTETPTKSTVDSPGRAGRGSAGRLVVDGLLRRRELSIALVTIVLALYFALTTNGFADSSNYHIIAQYFAPWAIIAAGEVMLLICGEIDLSAGYMFTLSPFVLAVFVNNGAPLIVALLGALVVCACVGIANGLIVTVLKMPSFITTLGMFFLLWGVALLLSGGSPVHAPEGGALVAVVGGWQWSELCWAIGIVIVMQIVLSGTRFGVYTFAVGGNPTAASEAGIRTRRIKTACFALTSLLAGFAGILDGVRVGSFDPTNGGANYMFLAVASAVIGGTALLGGSGTVVGALIGAIALGIVHEGFTLAGINANAFNAVLGIAVLAAMMLNIYLGRFSRAGT